jgi:hypothetical protein
MLADPKILRLIVNDPASTEVERTEALRALDDLKVKQSPHRRGRNSNVPMTQADQDSDLTAALTIHRNDGLTSLDRLEIHRSLDESTRAILGAIRNNSLLWIFTNNQADVPILIDCVNRTGSSIVKAKALEALQLIAQRSPIDDARQQAKDFLNPTQRYKGQLMTITGQDEVIQLSPSQTDPGKADPQDFEVSTDNSADVPGHGQRGENEKEFQQLLAIRASKAGRSHPTGHGLSGTRNTQPVR